MILLPLTGSKLRSDWRLECAREKARLVDNDLSFSGLLQFLKREFDIQQSGDRSDEKMKLSPRQ